MFSKAEDLLDAIGKNGEAQKWKIEQPMIQLPCPPATYANDEAQKWKTQQAQDEMENEKFKRGHDRGAEKMKAAILARFDAYVWASEVDHSPIFKEIRNLIEKTEV